MERAWKTPVSCPISIAFAGVGGGIARIFRNLSDPLLDVKDMRG